jgi:hypothetical protein
MRPLRALGLAWIGALAGLVGAAAVAKRALPSRGDEESEEIALVAILNGIQLENRATDFRGGSAFAWFGGIDLDLRDAVLSPGARLSVHALFGGVSIRVPSEWRIESRLHALPGGIDARGSEDEHAPTLELDGLAAFGGIAVGSHGGS